LKLPVNATALTALLITGIEKQPNTNGLEYSFAVEKEEWWFFNESSRSS
jgi:hypothetical protein